MHPWADSFSWQNAHPSESQLVAPARRQFVKYDQTVVTQVPT
jgi:hypothetical protein